MLKSMTGFGVVQGKVSDKRVVVETKSVNHKYCEVNLRISQRYAPLEGRIVEFTKSFFSRGRIDVLLREESHQANAGVARIDVEKLKTYQKVLKSAAKTLKIKQEASLATLLTLPQVVVVEEEEDYEKVWEDVRPLLKESFVSLEEMRQKEGLSLAQFLKDQLKALNHEVKGIEAEVPLNIENHKRILSERILKLTSGVELDPQRLATEVAYYVDRSDISEELQRLTSHSRHFQDILKSAGPHGRKLDFLLQEMNREVNTLSAKAQSADISQKVVECKHLLEKMREQVQNAE